MKRLYIALLWLFAVGFSSTGAASVICGIDTIDLGPAATSAECKTLYLAYIDNNMTNIVTAYGPVTLSTFLDDEYYCPSGGFDIFPCGAHWERWYANSNNVIVRIYKGYWQGIYRNFSLTFSLPPSEGASESSTVLRSVEPGSAAKYLYVWAKDDNTGELASGVGVSVTTDVIQNSGGHQHNDNRSGVAPGTLSRDTQSGKTISVNINGGAYFYFTPPAVAGDHTLTAVCNASVAPSTCSIGPGPNKVWVGIKDLQPLYDLTDYSLVGTTTIHPDNHYLTSTATTAVQELAYYYHSVSYPLSPVLHLNDASLERGGIFDPYFTPYTKQGVDYSRDIQGWWVPPHIEHRRGRVIDIRANGDAATAIPRANQTEFEKMLTDRQMTYIAHDLNKANGHYHVRLLGTEQ